MSNKTHQKPVPFDTFVMGMVAKLHHLDYRQLNVMVEILISRNRKGKVTGWSMRIVKDPEIPVKNPPMETNRIPMFFKPGRTRHNLMFRTYTRDVWNFLMGDQAAKLASKEVDLRETKNQEFKWLARLEPNDRRLEKGGKVKEFTLDSYDHANEDDEELEEDLEADIDPDRVFALGDLF